MTPAKWGTYPNFPKSEFDCKHSGLNEMKHEFMTALQAIRKEYGPMKITSGFRHHTHPVEVKKGHQNGEHTKGMCCDVACNNGADRYRLITIALRHGVNRIGIAKTFVHLGLGAPGLPGNVIWEYA
jgi:zinc D-Ala-D-Ala carboxypeptidase